MEKTARRFVGDTRQLVTNKNRPSMVQTIKRSNARVMANSYTDFYGTILAFAVFIDCFNLDANAS